MADLKELRRNKGKVVEVIAKYGKCLELIPMDPFFKNITVALYVKDGVATVWTFSKEPGVEKRIEQVRGQLVRLGGLIPAPGTNNQVKSPCGQLHTKPLKFLMTTAVEKSPDTTLGAGRHLVKDLKSNLHFYLDGAQEGDKWVYHLKAEGEAANPGARLHAANSGFARYGDMEKVGKDGLAFVCGKRHDEMANLILPYARNVSGVEDALEAQAMRGQMTTSTLGFAQT